jgi:hypothetical protein
MWNVKGGFMNSTQSSMFYIQCVQVLLGLCSLTFNVRSARFHTVKGMGIGSKVQVFVHLDI